MKKRITILLVICILAFSLTGCGETYISVNVENQSGLSNTVIGEDALIKIGNGLYYDSTTRVVYWWNGIYSTAYCATTPSPYYAPNGLPYRYNPETNTFEEINLD